MKIFYLIMLLGLTTSGLLAQNVNIPDANFKSYLIGNTAINTNADTVIQVSEATAFTGTIDCSSLNINDLTGIEAFTALTGLVCPYNQLISLNLTQNTALTELDCRGNQLTNLDVTQNTALTDFRCDQNQLTSIDVTQNTALTKFYCFNNQLSCLNVKNGNNQNIGASFDATNNPNLTCIEVDNVAWSTTNWTNIDAGASFSLNCGSPCSVGINENTINNNITIYPNPVKDQLIISSENEKINNIKMMDVTGKIILITNEITQNATAINVPDLPKGLYLLQIQTDKGIAIKRFIKE